MIVVGMHRSGTSVMTGALHRLGLHVGADHQLIGASQFNPTGHFEVKDLVFFNEMLLNHLGATWSCPPPLDVASRLAELAQGSWGDRARVHFEPWLPAGPWVLKDPRFSIVLPFWREIIEQPVSVVIMLRSPAAVAASLGRRSNLSTDHSLALWERYNQAAVRNADGLPTFIAHYERFARQPTEMLRQLIAGLGADDRPAGANLAEAAGIVNVGPHSGGEATNEAGDGGDDTRDLERLLASADGWLSPGFAAGLPPESRGLDEVLRRR